jgi:membrane-bound lytic murein transglycosylase B
LIIGLVIQPRDPGVAPLVISGGVPAVAPAGAPPPPVESRPDPLAAWAQRIEATTGIPPRALIAYAQTEAVLADESPRCRLNWVTVAAIARIESDHGRFQGRVLRADGTPDRAIVGVPLDGSPGVAAIPDTDGGHYDGDRTVDRAVGPMQFIPSTWRRWAADGDGDGNADPQDIDDAALAAGRYLCAAGGDLSTGPGWWRAVLAYNTSTKYAQDVLNAADRYAVQSHS